MFPTFVVILHDKDTNKIGAAYVGSSLKEALDLYTVLNEQGESVFLEAWEDNTNVCVLTEVETEKR